MTVPSPPGRTESIAAERALVVAPHFDDEVVGCGGLLAQLARREARVRVVFLSDGGGGVEEIGDRDAYRARRRGEAEAALAALGVPAGRELGLPDGRLEHHREAIATALRAELEELVADLVLVPSPLEVSRDHRAAFAALHDVLGSWRDAGAAPAWLGGLRVLVYEVNHPQYPDLLVDVSEEIATIERAMACYPSQQERHDYLAAAVGLRRYRTLSLGPEIAAAEGYRRLDASDFATRSPAALIRHLGGVPERLEVAEGPTVSVVVRTHDRPELLAEALASLADQTYRRVELVLVNDGGPEPSLPDGFPFPVRRVELPERRGRAEAANAGVAAATGAWLGFLDDDDRLEPEHLATLVALLRAPGIRVAYTDAAVVVLEPDGERGWREVARRIPYSRDFDLDLLRVDNYIPFHTLLAPRELLLEVGPLDPELPFFEDWDLLIRLARRTAFHHLARVTCEYRQFRGGAHVLGERPRERADFLAMKGRVIARHAEATDPDAIARVIDRLRAETVVAREEVAARRTEVERALRDRDEAVSRALAAEDRYHRAHGEAVALRGERERLAAELAGLDEELRRLYREESGLRDQVRDQDAHLGRLYAEIERQNDLLAAMRSTRAWRLHEWLQRRRG